MSVAKSASLTLEEFLNLPETKPASIYIVKKLLLKFILEACVKSSK
ncbi:MAG: hypothetical protein V7K68_09340 [Nostoc sp.]